MRFHLVFLAALSIGCGSPDPKDPGTTGPSDDAGNNGAANAQSSMDMGAAPTDMAKAEPDLPPQPAYCEAVDGQGFFPNCDACDAEGLDCDTIDAPGASGNACGCSGGCPCGLRCGSYEIAPNVTVSGICVR